jgi:hypothetical protein
MRARWKKFKNNHQPEKATGGGPGELLYKRSHIIIS